MLPVDQRWAPMLGRAPSQAEGGSLVCSAGCAQGNSEKAQLLSPSSAAAVGLWSDFRLLDLVGISQRLCELRIL